MCFNQISVGGISMSNDPNLVDLSQYRIQKELQKLSEEFSEYLVQGII